jgi:hypothetical protein
MRGPTLPRPARTAFRRAATLAGLAALTVGLLALGATPARAGGPTSVLVVNYDGSRAAAALTGSQAYDHLATALDAFSGEPPRGETAAPTAFLGTGLRLTWLVHDVTPWRLDAVQLDGGDIWVNTVVSWDGRLFDQPGVWHRPADEALLRATLTSMGVLGRTSSVGDAAASPELGPATAPTARTAAPARDDPDAESTVAATVAIARPAWALPATGLLGLLIGWSVHRVATGRGTRARDPDSEDGWSGGSGTGDSDARGSTPGATGAAQTHPAPYENEDPVTRFTLR